MPTKITKKRVVEALTPTGTKITAPAIAKRIAQAAAPADAAKISAAGSLYVVFPDPKKPTTANVAYCPARITGFNHAVVTLSLPKTLAAEILRLRTIGVALG